jgi:hypothetical protein
VNVTPKPALTPAAGAPVVVAAAKPALTPAAGAPVVFAAAKPALTPAMGRPVVSPSAAPSEVAEPSSTGVPVPIAAEPAEPLTPRAARITGTLQVSPSGKRRTGQITVVERSVAVDPALVSELAAEMAAAPVTPPPVSAKDMIAGAAKADEATPPLQRTGHGDASHGGRVTGSFSISSSQRTNAPKTTNKELSVQLDPVLVAELSRLEKATAPMETATSDIPTVPIKSGGGRITGTLSSGPSPRSVKSSRMTPGAGVSVAVDPALAQEVQRPLDAGAEKAEKDAPKPEKDAPKLEKDAPKAETPPAHAQPAAADGEGTRAGSRISGAFDAVESDFFAREADLYKKDGDDNFSDLDEPAGKSVGGKNGSRRQNRR